jgi:hypothetical protein
VLMTNEIWWEFQEGCVYHRDSTAPVDCEDCTARLWVDEEVRTPIIDVPISKHLRHACFYKGESRICTEYHCPRLIKLIKPVIEIPAVETV